MELGQKSTVDNTVIRKKMKKETNSSCIALNYDVFKELYGIDLQRSTFDASEGSDVAPYVGAGM